MVATVDDVINALGGTVAVAESRGLPRSTVSSWRKRKSIPGEFWAHLADIAEEKGVSGVTVETLAEIHRKPCSPEPAEARA